VLLVRSEEKDVEKDKAYQAIFLEDLLAFRCQLHIVHGGLPAVRISADFDAHGSTDDLVTEADSDDANAALSEDFGYV
jgi:hypothetical protein